MGCCEAKDPEFIEGDVFRIIVPLDEKFSVENTTQSVSDGLEENILKLMREELLFLRRKLRISLQ